MKPEQARKQPHHKSRRHNVEVALPKTCPRYYPPSLLHKSAWTFQHDRYFVNCARTVYEHEDPCFVEIAKREVHPLRGEAIAQVSPALLKAALADPAGASDGMLRLVLPILRHVRITRGPLRIEYASNVWDFPEMADHPCDQLVLPLDGLWLKREISAEEREAMELAVGAATAEGKEKQRAARKGKKALLEQAEVEARAKEAAESNSVFE